MTSFLGLVGELICLFSAEVVGSARYPGGESHWASCVKRGVCACPEMVCGILHQSEEDSTVCSKGRQMLFQSWTQLVHLKREK